MKKALLVVVFSSFFLVTTAWAEEPVVFKSAALQAAVEEELWVPDPTPSDMLGLTQFYASNKSITDMTGLEYATNLRDLRLPCNWITSISVVATLSNLEVLVMNNNEIGDLSPLAGLSNLRHLDFHDNHRISNLSPLTGLSALNTLILRGNQISDLWPLSGLNSLENLELSYNDISDISPLCGLTNLSSLDLRGNPLSVTSYDLYLPQIVANNPNALIQPRSSSFTFSISSTAGGSVMEPGEGDLIFRYGESIRLRAAADPCFLFVRWAGTYSTPQNPMVFTADQDLQIRAYFQSTLNILYVDDDGAGDPAARDSLRSDPLENGTLEHPFDRVQEAIEVAADGASILVRPGIYRENLDLLGKNIHLLGGDPNDPNRAAYPVLESTHSAPAVRFASGEGRDCTLTGFVITRGKAQPAAAILCHEASPTIANCLIVGNRAGGPNGAAIQCIRSSAAFRNCTIADNYGGPQGAGLLLVDSSIGMMNSIIWGNTPNQILALGDSSASIRYSAVWGGWPDVGNLDTDPLFARPGSWVDSADPGRPLAPSDERAVWTGGDYHTKSQAGRWDPTTRIWVQDDISSPCLDAGDPASPVEYEPAPDGGRINLGAYGGTAQASKSFIPAGSP